MTNRDFIIGVVFLLVGIAIGCAITPRGSLVDSPLAEMTKQMCTLQAQEHTPNKYRIVYCYLSELSYNTLQCLLFDSDKKNAKLLGVEYIIGKTQYDNLAKEEKPLWSPCDYLAKSGLLVSRNLWPEEEYRIIRRYSEGYSKSYYTWPYPYEATPQGKPVKTIIPMKDGDVSPETIKLFENALKINVSTLQQNRQRHFSPTTTMKRYK